MKTYGTESNSAVFDEPNFLDDEPIYIVKSSNSQLLYFTLFLSVAFALGLFILL